MDKVLIVLSTTSSGVSIISVTSILGALVGIARASFTLIFSLTTGIVKKLLNITRNIKKKHDKILMLVKSKLNSSSVFCYPLGQTLKIPSKRISLIPMHTYFDNF